MKRNSKCAFVQYTLYDTSYLRGSCLEGIYFTSVGYHTVVLTSVKFRICIIVGLTHSGIFGHHDDTNAIFIISGEKTDYFTFTLMFTGM